MRSAPSGPRQLTHVSADGAAWIATVSRAAPQAVRCADPFHVVGWATEALDEVRRQAWHDARAAGGSRRTRRPAAGRMRLSTGDARDLRGPATRCGRTRRTSPTSQQAKLAWIAKTDPRLHRAYLLKEGLRTVFETRCQPKARDALTGGSGWAARCRIPEFVALGRRIRAHLPAIHATINHRLSNGLIESVNTKIRLLTRMAFGFHNPHALIALAMLALGGLRPALPGR